MTWVILAATYANEDNTSATIVTVENGPELISLEDRPEKWAIFEEWVSSGGAVAPFPAPIVEQTIHIAWLRAALAEAGKLTAVDRAVSATGPVQKQLWDYATTIRRNHPSVVAIAAALDLDLDALFARAAAIRGEQA